MNADWIISPHAQQEFFTALPGLHPLTAQTLFARGFVDPTQAAAFLKAEVPRVDPFSLQSMDTAVERILQAIGNSENLAVYGDYDCDGVTACALLMTTLQALGAKAQPYIPDRFEEGYGLNSGALDKLKALGVSLVITVDCGVRAVKEAAHAKQIGLDLIVTDHHELEDNTLPDAFAVINPKRFDCRYGFKYLAGVGVAFRLAQCLLRTHRDCTGQSVALKERELLDLVAIGTVADIVSLTGENRSLVRAGIEQMNDSPRMGVKALLQAARIMQVDAGRIGFGLGPRLNAAGRLEHALAAYELLMTNDRAKADDLAQHLNLQNEQRQSVTAQMAAAAEGLAIGNLLAPSLPSLLFAASEEYNSGVIGLAAARLVEKHYRPSVVVSISNGEARGSCRSVHGFDITEALDECRELLLKHGGHAAAAGFTARTECLGELQARLSAIASMAQPTDGWKRALKIDGEVRLSAINWKAVRELEQLEPHGMGNPRPVFVARGVRVLGAQRMGKAEAKQGAPHLKLKLKDNGDRASAVWDAVMWRAGERIKELNPGDVIDVAFQVEATSWNGEQRLQLDVRDFCVLNADGSRRLQPAPHIPINPVREHPHRLHPNLYRGNIAVAFTLCVQDRTTLFTEAETVTAFEEILREELAKHECDGLVYLMMPDHMHLIISGKSAQADTLKCLGFIKQRTRYWLSQNRPTHEWQKDFYDHILRKEDDIRKQMKYILENPQRKGLVEDWRVYPFKGSTVYRLDEWDSEI
jgi:single-stranded-DNA-specific exonuclease